MKTGDSSYIRQLFFEAVEMQTGEKIYLPCLNLAQFNSFRTRLTREKNRYTELDFTSAESLTFSKFVDKDKNLYLLIEKVDRPLTPIKLSASGKASYIDIRSSDSRPPAPPNLSTCPPKPLPFCEDPFTTETFFGETEEERFKRLQSEEKG